MLVPNCFLFVSFETCFGYQTEALLTTVSGQVLHAWVSMTDSLYVHQLYLRHGRMADIVSMHPCRSMTRSSKVYSVVRVNNWLCIFPVPATFVRINDSIDFSLPSLPLSRILWTQLLILSQPEAHYVLSSHGKIYQTFCSSHLKIYMRHLIRCMMFPNFKCVLWTMAPTVL